MTNEPLDDTIRRAIGGDADAATRIAVHALVGDNPSVMVVAAILACDPTHLDRALAISTTSRDRQLVEIACAYVGGRPEQVDALSREHLVDHPGNLVVAWIASGAAVPLERNDGA
jgi:hypothetical protein